MAQILHITDRSQWQFAEESGEYVADSLLEHGFIHCSKMEQVITVANSLLKGQRNLVLLDIDTERINARIVYENLEGGADLFPHIYGPINVDAVVKVYEFHPDSDGTFDLPIPLRKNTGWEHL